MKFAVLLVFSVTICQSLAESSSVEKVSDGVNAFSLNFFKQLKEWKKNVVFSPLSISMAFGMLLSGARGSTAQEIKKVLNLNQTSETEIHYKFQQILNTDLSGRPNLTLTFGNMALVDNHLNHYQAFEEFLRQAYQVHFESADFSRDRFTIMNRVNQFVNEKTHGLIQKILEEPLPVTTKLLLLNTIYFHGSWKVPFVKQRTQKRPFYGLSGESTQTDTMFRETYYKVHEDHEIGFTALELPYEGDVSMYVLLPKEKNGLPNLLENLSHEKLESSFSSLQTELIRLYFPKFKFEFQPRLKDILGKLGADEMFDERANLTGIAPIRGLYVDDALHKAVIEVDETSTKAAAVTSISIGMRSAMVPNHPKVVRVEHPFAFVIRDKIHNVNLFSGAVFKL